MPPGLSAYYNENDPYAARWLGRLIDAGLLPPGDVDERSIVDVRPRDIDGYGQCHFFAGIGGWPFALSMAGWPRNRPVWTGSCPCQPFSAAGKRQGFADERHLWPVWHRLIGECHPATILGEQVEAGIRQGWLDAVFSDLEAEGYACGATVLPACGVGAPHIRQRAWFVADSDGRDASTEGLQRGGEHGQRAQDGGAVLGPDGLPDIDDNADGLMADAASGGFRELGDATQPRRGGHAHGGFWSCDWLPCTDGKARPIEPGSFPLAHGVQRRTSKLRAYGNAIVPQVAAEFIAAYLECRP